MLGDGKWSDVPISRAVAASTALPLVYEPVEIKGREMMDGGILSTTNIDIAVEKGAKFIVVVNPIVPFVNDFSKRVPTVFGSRVRRVSDMAFVALANQAMRMIAHDRRHRAVEEWSVRYPGVDIILIQPDLGDETDASHLDHGLQGPPADRQARFRVGDPPSRPRLRALPRDRRAPRHRDLRRPDRARARSGRARAGIHTLLWRRVFEQTTGALLKETVPRGGPSGRGPASALASLALSVGGTSTARPLSTHTVGDPRRHARVGWAVRGGPALPTSYLMAGDHRLFVSCH